jgi:DNA-binding beta-propeller fold protein YncE
VHKYTPDGKLLFSWGDSGTDPGEFNIVHNIATDSAGWVYVADRENHRIQVFDPTGKFETQWVNMARPCGLYIDQASDIAYVGELGVAIGSNAQANGVGPRISLYDTKGNVLARLGNKPEGEAPGQFIAPHGICIDSRGDIYLGEVSWTHTGSRLNPPRELRSLQKLVRQHG